MVWVRDAVSSEEPILRQGVRVILHTSSWKSVPGTWKLITQGGHLREPLHPRWLSGVLFGCWAESLQKAAVHICGYCGASSRKLQLAAGRSAFVSTHAGFLSLRKEKWFGAL